MTNPSLPPKKTIRSSFVNLGFPTMIRKARWSEKACGEGHWRGLDTIIYSAFAVEAFVNDFATMGALLDMNRAPHEIPMAVKALLRAESKRKPTMDKVIGLYHRLSGTKPHRGNKPLQDLSLLFDLRDEIVHSKADIVTEQARAADIAELLTRLNQRGELVPRNLRNVNDWRIMLDQSPGVANWSLNTAHAVAVWIHDVCPDSNLKRSWLVSATGRQSAMFVDR